MIRGYKIQELEAEKELWERQFETLNEKLEIALNKYKKERQKVYYLKRTLPLEIEKVRNLNESIESLENENEELKEQLDELMKNNAISLFKNGKYTKEIKMLYYDLLSLNARKVGW